MKPALPPLDAHAHIATGIHGDRLELLRSAIVAVTRSVDEWDETRYRNDPLCVWAIGLHPGHRRAAETYRPLEFRARLNEAAFVGEVGLERHSPVRAERQREVFDDVLAALEHRPRPTSVHSRGRSREVLDAVQSRPVPGLILHWWTGDPKLTETALNLGCYFSVNAATTPTMLRALPRDRVLTETDFPFVERVEQPPAAPGDVEVTEELIASIWGTERFDVRRQVWRNLGAIYRATDTSMSTLSREMQLALLTAS